MLSPSKLLVKIMLHTDLFPSVWRACNQEGIYIPHNRCDSAVAARDRREGRERKDKNTIRVSAASPENDRNVSESPVTCNN